MQDGGKQGSHGGGAARRTSPDDCRLSYNQERTWFLSQLEADAPAFYQPLAVEITGPLDPGALENAFRSLLGRHDTLRLSIENVEGQPAACLASIQAFSFEQSGFPGLGSSGRKTAIQPDTWRAMRNALASKDGALVRAALVELGSGKHALFVLFHELVCDRFSTGLFLGELAARYEAISSGRDTENGVQAGALYRGIMQEERRVFGGAGLEDACAYWRARLAGPLPVLDLPTDFPLPSAWSYDGAHVARDVDEPVSRRMHDLARQAGVSVESVLLAGFAALLSRHSNQNDQLVGVSVNLRDHYGAPELIGPLENMATVRMEVRGDSTFRSLLRAVDQELDAARKHGALPFARLLDALQPERDIAASPLFRAAFEYRPRIPEYCAGPVRFAPVDTEAETAPYFLTLRVTHAASGVTTALVYSTALFEPGTARRMLERFHVLLGAALEEPDTPLHRLPILPQDERDRLVLEWNATDAAYPLDALSLQHLLQAQVERTPDAVALEFEGVEMTYEEYNRRANRLAHYLRRAGAGAGATVGVALERSLDLIIAICGLVKAGAAYVPVDPAYPGELAEFMLRDAGASLLITERRLLARFAGCAVEAVCLDEIRPLLEEESSENLDVAAAPDDPLYIIYTSGSTGTPKGVINVHRGICNHLLWMCEQYPLQPGDRVMQKTPFSFDVSVWEIFWPLVSGARLVIARPEGHKDTRYLIGAIQEHGITDIHFVPSMLRLFLEEPRAAECRSLKRVICSGEALPYDLRQRFFSTFHGTVLLNLFGPTEAAVHVTACECRKDAARHAASIGRPIANTQMYVLDEYLQPQPIGVVGELYIGGVQVAHGYLNRPELTEKAFIPDPFRPAPGARLYRTGDLGRFLPDGAIEFLGRADFQVKYFGARIELGEIESRLLEYPGVSAAVVVMREDKPDDRRLVAYVVPAGGAPIGQAGLREHLTARLAAHMIPSDFVMLERIPLSPNGKVDRRALPPPGTERRGTETAYAPPRTPVETGIADIWKAHLRMDRIGIDDNFFVLGGRSMLAMRVMARICDTFKVDVPLRVLFERPTIRGLASAVEAAVNASTGEEAPPAPLAHPYHPCIVPLQEDGDRVPLFCILGAGSIKYCYSDLASCLGYDGPLYGLQYSHIEEMEGIDYSVEEIAALYVRAIRSVQPAGPYLIAGWSFGGIVAYEIAQQLHAAGEQAPLLALIDCGAKIRIRNPLRRLAQAMGNHALRTWNRCVMLYHSRAIILAYIRSYPAVLRSGKARAGARKVSLKEYLFFMRRDIYRQYHMRQGGLAEPGETEHGLAMLQDSFIRKIVETLRANEEAYDRYVMRAYPGAMALFRPKGVGYAATERDATLGWGTLAMGGVDVHVIEGNHITLMRRPHVESLARALQSCLVRACQELGRTR